MFKIFYEDIELDHTDIIGTVQASKEDIVRFATEFDPQPFHLDDEFAKSTPFGGLCASGWHTCSLIMRAMVDYVLATGLASLGSPGLQTLQWRKPFFPDDTLSISIKTVKKTDSRSRPEIGFVTSEITATNQNGDIVLFMINDMMTARRKPLET